MRSFNINNTIQIILFFNLKSNPIPHITYDIKIRKAFHLNVLLRPTLYAQVLQIWLKLSICLNFTNVKICSCWCWLTDAEESSVPDSAATHAMRQLRVGKRPLKVATERRLCVCVTFSLRPTHVYPQVNVALIWNNLPEC